MASSLLLEQIAKLNKEQREVVRQPKSQVVIAGAGSGKTTVLVSKIAYLLCYAHAKADDILAVTFTRKAGDEMSVRLQDILSDTHVGMLPYISNFHSAALRIIRSVATHRPAALAAYGWRKNFTITDPKDGINELMRRCESPAFERMQGSDDIMLGGKGKEGKGKVRRNIKMLCERYQRHKDNVLTPYSQTVRDFCGTDAASSYLLLAYEENNRLNNTMDFADIIRVATALIQDLRMTKKYIFVDELQDTNANQFSFLAALYNNGARAQVTPIMFGVGDIDQGIYEWRSAMPQNAIKFRDSFDCKENHLVINYRSTPSIVHASNAVIKQNKKRIDKSMIAHRDNGCNIKVASFAQDRDEATYIAQSIAEIQEEDGSTCAVLVRGRRQVPSLELALRKLGITPALRKDLSMLSNQEVKRTISMLKLYLNPKNAQNNEDILSMLEGFGPVSRTSILDCPTSPWSVNANIADLGASLNRKQESSLERVRDGIRKVLGNDSDMPLLNRVVAACKDVHIHTILHGLDDDKGVRKNKVLLLLDWVSGQVSLTAALDDLMLAPDGDMENKAAVSIMTVHGAKGLEFDHVFVAGANEKNYPSKEIEENEESRRLFYVALTRAAKSLTLTSSSFTMGESADMTGMVKAIPKSIVEEGVTAKGAQKYENTFG